MTVPGRYFPESHRLPLIRNVFMSGPAEEKSRLYRHYQNKILQRRHRYL